MATTQKLRPAVKFGPGYFIKEQMEYRSWTQDELAEVMGMTSKHVNAILKDKQTITLDTAKVLAEVFDTSPQYWINLDSNYRLWLNDIPSEKEKQAELKANIYERMPVRDMIAKNWIPAFADVHELCENILEFWNCKKLDFEQWDKQITPLLARKSESFNQYKASYTYTWYHKAMMVASTYTVPAFDKKGLTALYDDLHNYTIQENGINQFLEKLNQLGVIFFVLPHLQKTYLDGAAFYYENSPVIVYTGRYKRIDNFWFTIAHEIAHILYHLDEKNTFFLDNFREEEVNDLETEANQRAAEKLKYQEIIAYLQTKLKYLSTNDIESCAQHLAIHPALIIGKLAFDKTISYANQRLYNEEVLELIDAKYLVNNG
ncbi:HigA family addiction module antitoxin [Flavobacterium paronense]|uniref:HigA family addiction module antitoxin n=1 Tax=Flavobacterium paronense TaxID=1392775 RepID=A0ABV5GCN4_9FLAO|nr:HigA family addiction module antitoxin [Flavobacterium paronense]MDN3676284.1 HigA family addiction module antitoxin [Flavobacterium paronense]